MIEVSENILREADFMAISMLSGCVMVFLYDVLRIFRKLVTHGTIALAIEDMLYWVFSALFIFAMLYRKNDGLIRGFAIGGIVTGMLVYNYLISSWATGVVARILKKLIRLFLYPLHLLGKWTKKPAHFMHHQAVRLWKRAAKLLKNVYKEVKIGVKKR